MPSAQIMLSTILKLEFLFQRLLILVLGFVTLWTCPPPALMASQAIERFARWQGAVVFERRIRLEGLVDWAFTEGCRAIDGRRSSGANMSFSGLNCHLCPATWTVLKPWLGPCNMSTLELALFDQIIQVLCS